MDTYSKYKDAFQFQPGGAASQKMVGDAIDSAFAEQRLREDQALKRRESALRQQVYQMKLSNALMDDMNDLNITSQTGQKGIDTFLNNAGRSLADYGGYLTTQLKDTGDYDTYANEMSKLKSQVGYLKNVEKGAKLFVDNANKMMADGELSDFTDNDVLMMAMDFERGAPNGKFETVDGQLEFVSRTPPSEQHPEGKEYRVAVSEFAKLNDKLLKKEDIDTSIEGAMKVQTSVGGNVLGFDEKAIGNDGSVNLSAKDIALDNLDTIVSQNGNEDDKIIRKKRSLLVDHFGLTKDETLALAQTQIDPANLSAEEKDDGVRTMLDRKLRDEWINRARGIYGINTEKVQNLKQSRGKYYLDTQDQFSNIADVTSIQNNLPNMTYKNQDGSDVMSGSYQGIAVTDGDKRTTESLDQFKTRDPMGYQKDLFNSLVNKGFHNPQPVFGQVSQAMLDRIAAEKNDEEKAKLVKKAIEIQTQPIGYRITNHKLTSIQRPKEDIIIRFDDDLNTQWRKVGQAHGLAPTEWLPRFKPGTNDPIQAAQGRGRDIKISLANQYPEFDVNNDGALDATEFEAVKKRYPNVFNQ